MPFSKDHRQAPNVEPPSRDILQGNGERLDRAEAKWYWLSPADGRFLRAYAGKLFAETADTLLIKLFTHHNVRFAYRCQSSRATPR